MQIYCHYPSPQNLFANQHLVRKPALDPENSIEQFESFPTACDLITTFLGSAYVSSPPNTNRVSNKDEAWGDLSKNLVLPPKDISPAIQEFPSSLAMVNQVLETLANTPISYGWVMQAYVRQNHPIEMTMLAGGLIGSLYGLTSLPTTWRLQWAKDTDTQWGLKPDGIETLAQNFAHTWQGQLTE